MLVDTYVDMFEAGKLTNGRKAIDRHRTALPSRSAANACTIS